MKNRKKRVVWAILCSVLVVLGLACFAALHWLGSLLPSQEEAQRWQGESELDYTQLSVYLPLDGKLDRGQIFQFRNELVKKLHEAALDVEHEEQLWRDAWSTAGKAVASTDLGRGDAAVIAVGGAYFDFHPIRLLSGNYISEDDLMQDRVLLDEDLAWLLFGGTDLTGLQLQIDGQNFIVAGVIRREEDFASKKAYTNGMGLYMAYDAYAALHAEDESKVGIDCYELVMAEPVKGFALPFVRDKFPFGEGEVVQNTGRFDFWRTLKLVPQFGERSMQKYGVLYPYWENAARCVEDYCALLGLLAILFLIPPGLTAVFLLVQLLRKGKEKLEDEWIPEAKDKAEEAVRVRQRRRWERKHGMHEQ